jgi:methylenetetrahydrofolate dehydrogenase (NADP+)/methenyltetrahydrofolate cyclohydrolase
MTAKIIDGKGIAARLRAEYKQRVDVLKAIGIQPGIAAIMVGDNPASKFYLQNKVKACTEVGRRSEVLHLDENTSQSPEESVQ